MNKPIDDIIYLDHCIICGKTKYIVHEKATWLFNLQPPFKIVRCDPCRFSWLNPRPADEAYKKMYNDVSYFIKDHGMPESSEIRACKHRMHFQARIKRIKRKFPVSQKIRLLDIGSATGEFVALCRESGMDAIGLEVSAYALEKSKKTYGDYFYKGELGSFPRMVMEHQFHVVHLNHTFEHFLYPYDWLITIRDLLAPDGFILLEVPHEFNNIIDRLKFSIRRSTPIDYSLLSIHHPFFYSPKAISFLLSKAEFQIISLKTYLPSEVVESNIFGGEIIKRCLLRFGDILFKTGDIIEVMARKK